MTDFKRPLVSVITVVYNGASTIEQTIQSVINQTYKNIEYIIIDGGSTDGTKIIVNKYRNNITYFISESDNGLYDAMNKGIKQSKGDIVGIINSDDWYDTNAIEQVVDAFETDSITEVVCGVVINITEQGEQVIQKQASLERIWYQMPTSHPAIFCRKSVYEKYGLFDLTYKIAADYELMMRFFVNNVNFKYINYVLAYFREGGISQRQRCLCAEEYYRIAIKYIDNCENKEKVFRDLREGNIGWAWFEGEIEKHPSIIKNILKLYMDVDAAKIVIFGTGKWGKICYRALLKTKISIKCFADNKSDKIHRMYGKDVLKPSDVGNDSYMIVAVRDYDNEITVQLDNMKIKNYICMRDIKNMYFRKIFKKNDIPYY